LLHVLVIRETPNSKPKKIGRYDDVKNTFYTSRDYTKHLLRNQNAWALDFKLLEEFLIPRDSSIVIVDSKRSTIYKTTAKEFLEKGNEIEYLNHRKQICMNLDYFTKEKSNEN